MKKVFSIMLCLLALPLLMSSCSDNNDEPDSPKWFSGKQFTALTSSVNVNAWILTMDGKGGVGYDGRFKVVPYWYDPNVNHIEYNIVSDHNSYTGTYQVDYNNSRLFITYDGYSGNSVWYFGDCSDQNSWPNWSPNRYIQIPSNATGELAGLRFEPGNMFESF